MSEGLVFNMVGGGGGGGGFIENLTLQNEAFVFNANDVRFNVCSFIQDIVHISSTSSNVSFTNCVFKYSQITCTQSIRDAIESDSSNIIEEVTFNIVT